MNKIIQKALSSLLVAFFVGVVAFGFVGSTLAEGEDLACTLLSSEDDIEVGGATTLSWDIRGADVVRAYLQSKDSDSWKQEMEISEDWIISGILDSRGYVLTVEDARGVVASCEVMVNVEISDEDRVCVDWDGDGWGWDGVRGCRMDGEEVDDTDMPSCQIYTSTVSTREMGVTLHWYYSDNITGASIAGVGDVFGGDNWKWLKAPTDDMVGYEMTVETSDGQKANCTVEVEIESDEIIG